MKFKPIFAVLVLCIGILLFLVKSYDIALNYESIPINSRIIESCRYDNARRSSQLLLIKIFDQISFIVITDKYKKIEYLLCKSELYYSRAAQERDTVLRLKYLTMGENEMTLVFSYLKWLHDNSQPAGESTNLLVNQFQKQHLLIINQMIDEDLVDINDVNFIISFIKKNNGYLKELEN